MSETTPAAPETDVSAWAERFLVQCGPCDGGLPMDCACPTEDPRPVIAALLERVRVVEGERDAAREALRVGAELDNHHNADACPYCTGGTTARAESAEAALTGARDDIKARRQEFRRLGADERYLLALDDAFGLVSNRLHALAGGAR